MSGTTNRWREACSAALALLAASAGGCNAIFDLDCFQGECGDDAVGADASTGAMTTLNGDGGAAAGGGGSGGGTEATCGDGAVTGEEACDDGNVAADDGCDASCGVEPGYTCAGAPSDCEPIEPVTVEAGPGLNIPLDVTQGSPTYAGSLGSMHCVTLAVPLNSATKVMRVEATVGIAHTWSGDLVVKVVSPTMTVVTVMNRPGFSEPGDYAAESGDLGASADLATSNRITFRDGAATSAESLGAGLASNAVACRDDGMCEFAPSPGKGPGTNLQDFAGGSPSGDWQICVADGDDTELGTLDYVGLSVLAW